jgi:diguanylate cyclase (GGDEF)-like protein
MSLFLRVDINIAAIVLLGIVVMMAFERLDRQDNMNTIYLYTSFAILLELIFETLSCLINGRPQMWLIPISIFLHMCLYIVAPILTYLWLSLIYNWVIPNDIALHKKHVILLLPIAIDLLIIILSPIYGFVFTIDSVNIYHRGPLYFVTVFVTFIYLMSSFVLIIIKRQKIIKEDFLPLFIFGILPLVGGLAQSILYGTLLLWSCTAFSLVIVYIFLQQRMIHRDKLTGTWTRGSFDYYIEKRISRKNYDRFGVIFIDIDGLKQINDEYGHSEGDYALKKTVELIKKALRKTDIVARLGGDEFIIILDNESKEKLQIINEKIMSCFAEYNKISSKKYNLQYSCGIDIFDSSNTSIEQFMHHIDSLMYSQKREKKIPPSQFS